MVNVPAGSRTRVPPDAGRRLGRDSTPLPSAVGRPASCLPQPDATVTLARSANRTVLDISGSGSPFAQPRNRSLVLRPIVVGAVLWCVRSPRFQSVAV